MRKTKTRWFLGDPDSEEGSLFSIRRNRFQQRPTPLPATRNLHHLLGIRPSKGPASLLLCDCGFFFHIVFFPPCKSKKRGSIKAKTSGEWFHCTPKAQNHKTLSFWRWSCKTGHTMTTKATAETAPRSLGLLLRIQHRVVRRLHPPKPSPKEHRPCGEWGRYGARPTWM